MQGNSREGKRLPVCPPMVAGNLAPTHPAGGFDSKRRMCRRRRRIGRDRCASFLSASYEAGKMPVGIFIPTAIFRNNQATIRHHKTVGTGYIFRPAQGQSCVVCRMRVRDMPLIGAGKRCRGRCAGHRMLPRNEAHRSRTVRLLRSAHPMLACGTNLAAIIPGLTEMTHSIRRIRIATPDESPGRKAQGLG
jgi:hypothetical protein